MIIDFDLKINNYNKRIEEKTLDYDCPNCRAWRSTKYYGTYTRYALILTDDGTQIEDHLLTIKRVICKSCKKTHAVLPSDIIPYKQYSLSMYLIILQQILIIETPEKKELMNQLPHQLVYEILRVWREFLASIESLLRVTYQIYLSEEEKILQFVISRINSVSKQYVKNYKWMLFMTHHQKQNPKKITIGISEI